MSSSQKEAMATNGRARDPESCKIIWWISISVSLAACCFVAVIVVGVVIVKPVVETDSLSFQTANCTTVKSYWTGETPGCNCGKNCHSWYPCYRYLVQYVPTSGGNGTARRAVMFDTEGGLNNGRTAGENLQCATRPCDRDHGKDALASFNSTYGEGQTYNCLYNPKDPDFVILERLFSWDAMFHGMLWPSIGFVIFTALTVYWIVRLKKISKKTTALIPESTAEMPGNNDQPTQYAGFTYN